MSERSLTRSTRPAFNFLGRKDFFQLFANGSFPKWEADTSQVPKRWKDAIRASVTCEMQTSRHEGLDSDIHCCAQVAQVQPPQKIMWVKHKKNPNMNGTEKCKNNMHSRLTQAEESVWYANAERSKDFLMNFDELRMFRWWGKYYRTLTWDLLKVEESPMQPWRSES